MRKYQPPQDLEVATIRTSALQFMIYLEIGYSQSVSEYTLERTVTRDRLWHQIEVLLQSAFGAVVILIWPCPATGHQVLNPVARNRSTSHAFGG